MRRIIYSVLLVMAVLVNAQAYDFSAVSGGHTLYYNILDGSTVELAACEDGATGALVIPGSVSYNGNTYTVTQIGSNAFEWCSGLTDNITIPNSVTTIGDLAFAGCTGFTGTPSLPSGLTTIGEKAFYGCSGLTGLELPETVTSIGQSAFYNCSGLTGDLTIPAGIVSIAAHTFRGCTGLNGTLTMSEGLKTIGEYAFYNCSNLSGTLTLPPTVNAISRYAFYGCAGFTGDLVLPNPMKRIEPCVFQGCTGLNGELTIGYQVTLIEQNAFNGCAFSSIVVNTPNPPTIKTYSFQGIPDNTPLNVFCGKAQAYHDADNWSRFTNVNDSDNYPFIIETIAANATGIPTTDPIHGTIEVIQMPSCDNYCVFIAQAVADEGYVLDKWQGGSANLGSDPMLSDTVRTVSPGSSPIAEPKKSYKAVFKAKNSSIINLSVFPAEGGTAAVTSGNNSLNFGQTITVKATPSTGYVFEGWLENDEFVSTDATYSFVSEGDRDLTARFYKEQATITAVCDPVGSARFIMSGHSTHEDTISGVYEHGQSVTLVVMPRSNWVFVCWKDQDGAFYSDETTLTIEADLDMNLTALLYSLVDVNENNATVDIFPNPTKGVFTIAGVGIESIAIYNTLGQIIRTEAVNDNGPQSIDLSEQPNGIYIVRITTSYGTLTKKIVKE